MRTWERYAPLTGVVAVVLWVLGAFLLALVMAIPTLGFFGIVIGLPLWVLATSVLLSRPTPSVESTA